MSTKPEQVFVWELDRIKGEGRGGLFFNSEVSFVHEPSGITIVGWDGYDVKDNWDEFGNQYYCCTVEGTKTQLKLFREDLKKRGSPRHTCYLSE